MTRMSARCLRGEPVDVSRFATSDERANALRQIDCAPTADITPSDALDLQCFASAPSAADDDHNLVRRGADTAAVPRADAHEIRAAADARREERRRRAERVDVRE